MPAPKTEIPFTILAASQPEVPCEARSAVHVHPFLPLDARARVGIVGAEVHGVYPFKAEAEDSAKVPGYVRGVSDNSPGLEWTRSHNKNRRK